MSSADSVVEITKYLEKEAQNVDILHWPINENACLRVSETPFSITRRKTPAYSKLLAISNKYGYMVSGTPKGLSVFKTADAEDELIKGKSKGTNTAIMLETRKEIDLSHHSLPTHVGISADETHILVMTMVGKLLVFSLAGLVEKGGDSLIRTIDIKEEVRDMRPNPQALPNTVAVLTIDGAVLMADFTTGTVNTIVPVEDDTFVTAICWSRKGKQIVCGDTNAALTQRLPTDGTVKRTITPQEDDGNIGDEHAILAVDWISTYSFFVVYGQIPDGAFIPGSGGGGSGEDVDSEDDGFEDNMTTAYVISQENKKSPMQWVFVDDPCSSMMCPTRYPGFLIACISEWGPSAENILIMAGTSSDATMTIGYAAADSGGTFEWGQWDFDGDMAVMPLSALEDCPNAGGDTYPIGIAIDYTGHCMLPPVEDDGDSVKPVPILWILNTDGCLLGYHVYNVLEMRQGTRSSSMVDKVTPLSELSSASTAPVSAFASGKAFGSSSNVSSGEKEKTKESDPALPKAFASSAFGSGGGLSSGAFGASSSFAPSFGKSSGVTPIVKPPTTMGLTGQHVFGSSGGGKPSTSFSGFTASKAAEDGSEGKSIFDTPSSGPSIFDPVGASKAASSSFGSTALGTAGTKDPAPFPSVASKTEEGASVLGSAANVPSSIPFGGVVATDKQSLATQPSNVEDLFGSMSSSLGSSKGSTFGSLSRSGMPSIGMFGSAKSSTLAGAKHATSGNSSGTEMQPTKRWDNKATPAVGTPNEAGSTSPVLPKPFTKTASGLLTKSQVNVKAEEEERKKNQERLDAIQHELEVKSQDLIKRQFISTCNLFDGRLSSLASAIMDTEAAITQVRETYLPNIPLNQAVLDMAGGNIQNDSLAIDDTKSWNCIADVLLEALQVSSEELRTSQDSLSKQLAGYLKTETKREEISRILESAVSASLSPNSTVDGGLNPLQRDYQHRLKHSLEVIDRRYASVEQVVIAEAARIGNVCGSDTSKTVGAPTTDSVRRTLQNVATTLCQRNFELDELSDMVGSMNLNSGRRSVQQQNNRKEQSGGGGAIRSSLFKVDNSPSNRDESSEFSRTAASGGNPSSSMGGFGLRFEDLVVSDRTPEKDAKVAEPSNNSSFPHTKIRELKPRKSTRMSQRRTSLLHDTRKGMGNIDVDGSSTAPVSIYSTASAYIQSRKQRTLVKDVLTRANRPVPLIRISVNETGDAFQLGTADAPVLAPMPNLERYVQAFAKLKIETPEPELEDEWELVSKTDEQPSFDIFQSRPASLDEWTCSLCQLKNPNSATSCNICEAARPGATASRPLSTTDTSSSLPGFGLSKGPSFGAAAQNTPPQFSGSAPFPSFVPPTGKPLMSSDPLLTGSVNKKDSSVASLFGNESKPTSTNLFSEEKPPPFSMSMFVPPGTTPAAAAADATSKQEEVDTSSYHSEAESGDIDEEDEVTDDTGSIEPDTRSFEAPVVIDKEVTQDGTGRDVEAVESTAGSLDDVVIGDGAHSEHSVSVVSTEEEEEEGSVETDAEPLEELVGSDDGTHSEHSAPEVSSEKEERLADTGAGPFEESVVVNKAVQDDSDKGTGTAESNDHEEESVESDAESFEEPVVVGQEGTQDSDKDAGTVESNDDEDVGTTESPVHVEHSEAEEANSEGVNDDEVAAAAGSQESDGYVHVGQNVSSDVGNDNTPNERFPSDTESKIHSAVSESLDRNVAVERYRLDNSLTKLLGGVDVNVLTTAALAPMKPSDKIAEIAPSSPASEAAASPLSIGSLALGERHTLSTSSMPKQSQTTPPPAPANKKDTTSPSSTSLFFRPGRLGNFGGSKLSQAAVVATPPKADSDLPSAFSTQSSSTATPAFGSKLDRPAFGVASMSSYGDANKKLSSGTAKAQSGFGSMRLHLGSGFGAMTSPEHNPFAAYNGKGDGKSIFDDGKNISDQPKFKTTSHVQSSTSTPGQPTSAPIDSQLKPHDPIMDIINGSDIDDGNNNDDYDSE